MSEVVSNGVTVEGEMNDDVEFCKLCGYNKELHETERVQWVTDGCPGEWDE